MAAKGDNGRKCFTFIWKLENANYWWKGGERIGSPAFTVVEINETKWKLQLCFFEINYATDLGLLREADSKGTGLVEMDYELAFLSSDGTVLHSFERKNAVVLENEDVGSDAFPPWNEMFFARRAVFLSGDTLTVRCRMWKSVGEMSKDVQCFARTRITVEKTSSLFNIENFSSLLWGETKSHEIKSLETGEQLMHLELFLSVRQISDETIHLKIIPNFQNIITSNLQISIADASKNSLCFLGEFCVCDYYANNFTLAYTKRELMEKYTEYLSNDVLSLLCECSFCFGTSVEEIEGSNSNCPAFGNSEPNKVNDLSVPKGNLSSDLKSILNNSLFSDVKLKTRSQTYTAHKLILSVRSPVFKAMFSNDTKENINDCVDIEDLSDDTLLHMLRYIYSVEMQELDWASAAHLYEAADKYELLNLKDICSSYLRNNLCPRYACEALVLADMHQDQDLKRFVQDFVLRHGQDIINSEEWDQLMETNVKLAAETMRLKYKELPK